MKKLLSLLFVMVLGLVGCGYVSSNQTKSEMASLYEHINEIESQTYSILEEVENMYALAEELGISDEDLALACDYEMVNVITSSYNN